MTWTGAHDAPPSARIAALIPSLQPSERRVAEMIACDLRRAVELTAQELADVVGVGRATVVRTAQTLGYEGYPQLRVALARERTFDDPAAGGGEGALGVVTAAIERFVRAMPHTSSALTEEVVEAFVTALDKARRVVISANGLSAPLGYEAALRLATAGRPAEYLPDALAQSVAARQLGGGEVLLAISGSGVNRATLEVADAARAAGAAVLAVTGYARSALVERATVAVAVPPPAHPVHHDLGQTSRAAMALVIEALIEALEARRGPRARAARAATVAALSQGFAH